MGGEDAASSESAGGIGRVETDDAVGLFGQLFLDFVTGAGGVSHIEPANIVEVGDDGSIDNAGGSNLLDGETVGEREGAVADFHLGRKR